MSLWRRDPYEISTDHDRLDLERVHRNLAQMYWCRNIPKEIVDRSIQNSIPFGVYGPEGQIGFCRVITDKTTFAYLCDVYIEEPSRGKGLATWLMECVMAHSDLQGLRRFSLATRDAHGLYRQFGFEPTKDPQNWMEIKKVNIYDT